MTPPSSDRVDARVVDGVLTITLTRADRHNALDQEGYLAFAEALALARMAGVRAVLLAAEGRSFCAGNDLEHFKTRWPQGPDDEVARFLLALSGVEVPIVAAVQGAAIGIGATLLLHCDLVVAAEPAFLQYPFLKLGLAPEGGSTRLLRERVGPHRAMELLLSGRRIAASEALSLGLVTHVTPIDTCRATAESVARDIAALPHRSVAIARRRVFSMEPEAVRALVVQEIEDVNRALAASGES